MDFLDSDNFPNLPTESRAGVFTDPSESVGAARNVGDAVSRRINEWAQRLLQLNRLSLLTHREPPFGSLASACTLKFRCSD